MGAVCLAVERLDECNCVFGYCFGGVGGDAGDGDAVVLCGGEVDVVEACTAEEDDADAVGGEDGEDLGGEVVVYKGADGWG